MEERNTGGPAFPTQSKLGVNDTSTWITEIPGQSGMTLRDYFAITALQGILSGADTFWKGAAPLAYEYADAMLEARK